MTEFAFETQAQIHVHISDNAKQAEEFKQQREKNAGSARRSPRWRSEMMKALGGMGRTMSDERTGIRFDTAMQYDPAQ